MTSNAISYRQLRDAQEVGARVTDSERIPPLASGEGSECYPCVTIEVLADGEVVGEVVAWKVCMWCDRTYPNGSPVDRGGWDWCELDRDTVAYGAIRVEVKDDSILILSGDHVGSTVEIPIEGLPDEEESEENEDLAGTRAARLEEAEQLADRLQGAIERVYDAWSPEEADNGEVYDALTDYSRERYPSYRHHLLDVNPVDCELEEPVVICGALHCERPHYAVAGDEYSNVYPDAAGVIARATQLLQARIESLQLPEISEDELEIERDV